jgi:hypothetical protein
VCYNVLSKVDQLCSVWYGHELGVKSHAKVFLTIVVNTIILSPHLAMDIHREAQETILVNTELNWTTCKRPYRTSVPTNRVLPPVSMTWPKKSRDTKPQMQTRLINQQIWRTKYMER